LEVEEAESASLTEELEIGSGKMDEIEGIV
jgi:hypothetical protein